MKRIIFMLLLITNTAAAKEEVKYIDLGAQLLKDGYIERARNVLEKVDVSEPGFDFARYYTLKGILLQNLSYPTLSNVFFETAIDKGQDNPSVYIYEARNYWQLQDYPAVIDTLARAGDLVRESEQMMVLKAESYKRQGKYRQAWAVLDEGIKLFPASSKFYRQKFYYLLELGFNQAALEYARKYLSVEKYTAKDYLAVAFALRENKQLESATLLLEEAVLKYPDNDKLVELLGQIYIDQQHYVTAAEVFDWSSIKYPRFAYKAATLYLKADDPIRSLQLNRRILKQDDKFRQRLGIDIYLDDYESLVAKVPALKRYNLLDEDKIRYAVGYGYFRNGDYDNARKYLKQITDSRLFTRASQIFQQIENCQDEPLDCN